MEVALEVIVKFVYALFILRLPLVISTTQFLLSVNSIFCQPTVKQCRTALKFLKLKIFLAIMTSTQLALRLLVWDAVHVINII